MTTQPTYPVYVISKGRAEICSTAQFLRADGVDFKLVVEPQEADEYAAQFGAETLLILPFSNLGLGGIPARNWVWEHAESAGHKRHWILDDNIRHVTRLFKNKRVVTQAGPAFKLIEDFIDRYTNIGIAGMNYTMFVGMNSAPPFVANVHVYSCLLIDNDLPFRWRGRYNEDTDLNLQVLSAGLCTVLFNAVSIQKIKSMTMKGGNTDELYKGDGRLRMARSLEEAWPYIVTTQRRYDRPQHVVRGNWRRFDTPLERRTDIDWNALEAGGPNNYGMKLAQIGEIRSPRIRALLDEGTPDEQDARDQIARHGGRRFPRL